jgi:hypothetical protein
VYYFGDNLAKQLSVIFTNILQAIEEQDKEYLEEIMEKKLYNATIAGLD